MQTFFLSGLRLRYVFRVFPRQFRTFQEKVVSQTPYSQGLSHVDGYHCVCDSDSGSSCRNMRYRNKDQEKALRGVK